MIDFDELVRQEEAGHLILGVDRAFARRFYTNVPLREIEARTGEGPYLEKTVIYSAFVGGPLLLLASLAQSLWVLGYWSALFIPVAAVVWVVVHADSVRARAAMTTVSLVVAATAIGFGVSHGSIRFSWALALTYAASLWLSRLLYVSATFFLRAFVLRNRGAWEWLQGQFVVREVR